MSDHIDAVRVQAEKEALGRDLTKLIDAIVEEVYPLIGGK